MANSGIKASQAGTSLRTAITNMASPTKNMAEVMEQYGITLTDADGNMLSLSDVMGQLREKMGGLDESTQAAAASALFGKEAMSGMLAIINAAPADFDKLTEAINNSKGTTEEMASIMQDNAAGAFERLKSAIDVLFTQLSSILLPIFTQVVEKITEWVNWFGQLDAGTQKVILTIAGVAAAIGPVLIVIGKVITALSTIGGAISSVVGFVTSGITSIIGIGSKLMGGIQALFALIMAHPVVAVVTAIIAAILLLWNNCEAFRDAVGAIWDAIVSFFQAAADGIKAAFNGIVEFFSGIWQGIQGVFSTVAEVLGGFFSAAASAVQSAWKAVVGFFQGIWQGIQGVFAAVSEVLGGFFSAAAEAVKSAWNAVVGFFQGIWDGIRGVFSSAAETLGGFFSSAVEAIKGAWSAVVDFFSGIWDGIQGVFSTVAETLGKFFSDAWDLVQSAWGTAKEFFGNLWDGIKEKSGDAAEFIKDKLSSAWDGIKTIWDNAKSFFGGIFTNIMDKGREAAESIGDKLASAYNYVKEHWDEATPYFSGMWENIKNVFGDAWDAFKSIGGNIVGGIKDGISSLWGSFTGWFKDKFSGLVDGAKNLLGIHSPSKVFADIGKNVMLGLEGGIDGENGSIGASARAIITTIKESFSALAVYCMEIGRNAMASLADAMSSGISALQQKVAGLMSSIAAAAKAALGIHSPSRVFAGIGENMALGLEQGWENEYSSIKRTIENGMDFGMARVGIQTNAAVDSGLSHTGNISGTASGGLVVNIYNPEKRDAVTEAREWKKTSQQIKLGLI